MNNNNSSNIKTGSMNKININKIHASNINSGANSKNEVEDKNSTKRNFGLNPNSKNDSENFNNLLSHNYNLSQNKHVYDTLLKEVFIDGGEERLENSNKHSLETSIELQLLKLSNQINCQKKENSNSEIHEDSVDDGNNKDYEDFNQTIAYKEGEEVQEFTNTNNLNVGNMNNIVGQSYGTLQYSPAFMKITKDIYLCDLAYLENNYEQLLDLGITHIISWIDIKNSALESSCLIINLFNPSLVDYNKGKTSQTMNNTNNPPSTNNIKHKEVYPHNQIVFYTMIYKVMDILRHTKMTNGTCLFIDDYYYSNLLSKLVQLKQGTNQENNFYNINQNNEAPFNSAVSKNFVGYLEMLPKNFIRSILLSIFSFCFQKSVFNTLTLLNNKLLFFSLSQKSLQQLSTFNRMHNRLMELIYNLPVLRCFCGACLLIFKNKRVAKANNNRAYAKKGKSNYYFSDEHDERRLISCACGVDSDGTSNNLGSMSNILNTGGTTYGTQGNNSFHQNYSNANGTQSNAHESSGKRDASRSPNKIGSRSMFGNVSQSYCPLNNCSKYIRDVKETYKTEYKSLDWLSVQDDELFTGFKEDSSTINNDFHKKTISFGDGLESNLIVYSVKEKTNPLSVLQSNIGIGGKFISSFNNMQNANSMNLNNLSSDREVVVSYKCRICQALLLAERTYSSHIQNSPNSNNLSNNAQLSSDSGGREYIVLLNNLCNNERSLFNSNLEFMLKYMSLKDIGLQDLIF